MPTKEGRRRPSPGERDESASRCSLSREFHCEIDRGDHAVVPRNIFARDVERRPVIGARSREGETEGYVYPFVKSMQLQRNQPLIVIHAKHSVPGAIRGVVKDSVRRKRTGHLGLGGFDFGLQLPNSWFDYLDRKSVV